MYDCEYRLFLFKKYVFLQLFPYIRGVFTVKSKVEDCPPQSSRPRPPFPLSSTPAPPSSTFLLPPLPSTFPFSLPCLLYLISCLSVYGNLSSVSHLPYAVSRLSSPVYSLPSVSRLPSLIYGLLSSVSYLQSLYLQCPESTFTFYSLPSPLFSSLVSLHLRLKMDTKTIDNTFYIYTREADISVNSENKIANALHKIFADAATTQKCADLKLKLLSLNVKMQRYLEMSRLDTNRKTNLFPSLYFAFSAFWYL